MSREILIGSTSGTNCSSSSLIPFARMLEATVAVTVTGNVGSVVPDRLRRCAPKIAGHLVANVDRFAGWISDRVIRPWRQLVLTTVLRPGVAAPFRRHLKAEARIGDHVDPRCGCRPAGIEDGHIFPAILVEAAEAVEELKIRPDRSRLERRHLGLPGMRRRSPHRRLRQAGKLIGDGPTARDQHHPGG